MDQDHFYKFKASDSGDEDNNESTWELHQTSANENEPETYQIVETIPVDSYQEMNQGDIIHSVQTAVPSTSTNIIQSQTVTEIVEREITNRIIKAKPKKVQAIVSSPPKQSSNIRPKEFAFVDINHQQPTPATSVSNSTKVEIDSALSIFIIGCNLSFDMLDSDHFRKFVSSLNPNYKIPTSKSLKSEVLNKLATSNGLMSKRNMNYDSDNSDDEDVKRLKI